MVVALPSLVLFGGNSRLGRKDGLTDYAAFGQMRHPGPDSLCRAHFVIRPLQGALFEVVGVET